MRIVHATMNRFPPETFNGVGTTIQDLATAFQAYGHDVHVIVTHGGKEEDRKDDSFGYPVTRCRRPLDIIKAAAALRPDALIWHCNDTIPSAIALSQVAPRVIMYLHNAEFTTARGIAVPHDRVRWVANSHFTAHRLRAAFGLNSDVVPPFIQPERYRVVPEGRCVLFINPIIEKGIGTAVSLAAACPGIPFRFVSSWGTSPIIRAAFIDHLKAAGNVEWLPPSADTRPHYQCARLLLVPSVWEEAWGRVVSEAHVSGIPAVAADRGGLAEAVGPGGVVLAPDAPLNDWAAAVERLWRDDTHHAALSAAARTHAARPDMDPEQATRRWLSLLSD